MSACTVTPRALRLLREEPIANQRLATLAREVIDPLVVSVSRSTPDTFTFAESFGLARSDLLAVAQARPLILPTRRSSCAFPRLAGVVSLLAKPVSRTLPGASIDEELHPPTIRTANSESLAMTARAYARQARMSSASRSG